jgi:hypothetical protein
MTNANDSNFHKLHFYELTSGFAVFVVTDRRVEFGQRLAGHQRFQKTHALVWS